jgi:hypothetical protein
MTTERPELCLTALVPVGPGGCPSLSEALLSLAAQTCPDFDVVITVPEGDVALAEQFGAQVQAFEKGFSSRVRVVTAAGQPLSQCAELSRATYVSVVDPGDVVFGHWAETFVAGAAVAGGRGMATLPVVQEVERQNFDDGCVVTSVGPPRRSAQPFDLAHHLVSGPVFLGGLALPRLAVQSALPVGLPPGTEGWVAQLVVWLTCGLHEMSEVTYLRRRSRDELAQTGGTGWESDRDAAMRAVDQGGLTLATGTLAALQSGQQTAIAAAGTHAAAASAALHMLDDVRSSASWRYSAPLRAPGRLLRRFRP